MYPISHMIIAFFFGIFLGSLANWIAYRLLTTKTFPRTKFTHFLPIIGSWLAKKDAAAADPEKSLKTPFRPAIIELLMGVFTAFFYYFHIIRLENLAAAYEITMTHGEILTIYGRFFFQSFMITLLLAASLIDLDEKVIPDAITVPGTCFALLVAFLFPMTLPFSEPVPAQETVYIQPDESPGGILMPAPSVEKGPPVVVQQLDLLPFFPEPCWKKSESERMILYPMTATWPHPAFGVVREGSSLGLWGLLTALGCWWLWCFGLMRRVWHPGRGLKTALGIFWLRLTRDPSTRFCVALGNFGTILILLGWLYWPSGSGLLQRTPEHWLHFWSAIVGMGLAGGGMWIVRYVSSVAMQREAMGFGDVTLMAMLGAFLGWQPCVVLFFIAPVVGLVLALLAVLLYGETEIPYGPFLCGAAIMTIIFWSQLSEKLFPIFLLGGHLMWVAIGALVAMVALLAVLQWVKSALGMEK